MSANFSFQKILSSNDVGSVARHYPCTRIRYVIGDSLSAAELDLRPGGSISFEWDRARGVYNIGKILMLEPPHRLSYTWEALEPSPTTVTFELTAENDGTRLHLIHTGIGEGEDWDHYYHSRNSGRSVHLANLTAWLETGKETKQIERLQRKARCLQSETGGTFIYRK